jgi:transposase
MEEGRRLQRITRSAKDPVKLRRAIVVLMSAQGQSASAIKALMQVSDDYVRQVVPRSSNRQDLWIESFRRLRMGPGRRAVRPGVR